MMCATSFFSLAWLGIHLVSNNLGIGEGSCDDEITFDLNYIDFDACVPDVPLLLCSLTRAGPPVEIIIKNKHEIWVYGDGSDEDDQTLEFVIERVGVQKDFWGVIITLMTKKKNTKSKAKKKQEQPVESDSVFFMKLIFYFILGAIWIRLIDVGANQVSFSVPIGLLIGVLFARHEHFMIDRKIEYVVLLVAMVLSFYLPVGILIG